MLYEKNIIKRFNRKDISAFTEVYELIYNDVYYFARKVFVFVFTEPEDAVHDVFLSLLEKENNFDSINSLKAYIYKALKNRLINDIEHGKIVEKYKNTNINLKDESLFITMVESETIGLLSKSIDSLPPQSRRVMRMSMKGFSNKEISDILEISINTVYVHKQKAMRILKRLLKK